MDWQVFILGSLFGWMNRQQYRRFKRSYVSMARQQGKSFLQGINGTYIGGFSGYHYGKLFTAATKRRQSKIAWDEMAKFISADESLAEYFEVKEYKGLITAKKTHCTIEALSKESGYNGTRDLDETLISMITTRGFDLDSFAFEMDSYAINVLQGAVSAEDFFADSYCIDQDDDPFDETVWVKANPRTATSERGLERLRTDAETARAMGGSELRDFLTKSMNIWVTKTENTFVAPEDWNKAKTTLTLEDFRGERCWIGVDLSSGGDLTTIALEFE